MLTLIISHITILIFVKIFVRPRGELKGWKAANSKINCACSFAAEMSALTTLIIFITRIIHITRITNPNQQLTLITLITQLITLTTIIT
jgi:hypothetical protein